LSLHSEQGETMDRIQPRDSLLQEKVGSKVRCHVCERRCTIVPGGYGWCRTRRNMDGILQTLNYGAISSLSANPIEKKPFYHFHPGTRALTAGSWSCNFGCPWCQNWDISKTPPPSSGKYLSPEGFIEQVASSSCQGTSISFNEPTLSLEWSLDVFRLAGKRGLFNTYVSNGYMTPEALKLLVEAGLNAINVDLKGDSAAVRKYCKGIEVEKVWATCRLARVQGVHLEITSLVIPGVNDAEMTLQGIARRILTELGADVPWHVSAYSPAYKFTAPNTPIHVLERAWYIGNQAGLEYVYIGNVPGHPHDDTRCPGCGALLIKRMGFNVVSNLIRDGSCPRCGQGISGVWGF
jgi:pyruvate formate lyase activating enzyme